MAKKSEKADFALLVEEAEECFFGPSVLHVMEEELDDVSSFPGVLAANVLVSDVSDDWSEVITIAWCKYG